MEDRRRAVGRRRGRGVVVPQQLAVPGRHADDAAVEELHVLLDPVHLGDGHRGVPGGRVGPLLPLLGLEGDGRAPDLAAGLLVEGDQGGLRAAGGADEDVAVDQRRLGVGPAAGLTAVVAAEILLPDDGAIVRLQADQSAVGADGVDAIAVHGGGAARAGVAAGGAADLGGPELLAAVDVEAQHRLGVAAGAALAAPLALTLPGIGLALGSHDVELAADQRRRGVAAAQAGGLPGQPGTAPGPLRQQTGFLRQPGAVGAAEAGPVPGTGGQLAARGGPGAGGGDSSQEQGDAQVRLHQSKAPEEHAREGGARSGTPRQGI